MAAGHRTSVEVTEAVRPKSIRIMATPRSLRIGVQPSSGVVEHVERGPAADAGVVAGMHVLALADRPWDATRFVANFGTMMAFEFGYPQPTSGAAKPDNCKTQ